MDVPDILHITLENIDWLVQASHNFHFWMEIICRVGSLSRVMEKSGLNTDATLKTKTARWADPSCLYKQ